MLRRPLFWLTVSLLCLVGAVYFWRQGEEKWHAQQKASRTATGRPEIVTPSTTNTLSGNPANAVKPVTANAAGKTRYPFRVSNTDKTSGQLLKNDKAIHLMNALHRHFQSHKSGDPR